MQRFDADDHGRKGRGDRGIAHVADVRHALDRQVVNLSVEGALDLRRRAAEADRHAVARDLGDGEPVAGEPVGDGEDVGLGGSEIFADLVRGEPLVKVGRVRVVFAGHVGVEGGLLLGAAVEHQDQVGHGQVVRHLTQIVPGVGEGMRVALERDQLGFVDTVKDAGGGHHTLPLGECGDKQCTGQYAQGDVEGERTELDHSGWS